MEIIPETQSLHAYLTRLRCPREGRPEEGSASWQSDGDLFGASHSIDLSWSAGRIQVSRTTRLPQSDQAQEAWSLILSRPQVDASARWRLDHASGLLFVPAPGETLTIAKAISAVREQIVGLGQGARPGWEQAPRRNPRF